MAAGWTLVAWPDHSASLIWVGAAERRPEESPPLPHITSLVCPFGPAHGLAGSAWKPVEPEGDGAALLGPLLNSHSETFLRLRYPSASFPENGGCSSGAPTGLDYEFVGRGPSQGGQ